MASVEERVKQIIVEQLGVDEAEVTPTASFVDDLGADSLDTVELVMAFEEAFEIEIPDEDAEKIRTVQDAVTYIDQHAKAKKYPVQPGPPIRAKTAQSGDPAQPANQKWFRPPAAGRKENADLMASVEERVKQIIVEQLGVDEGEVTPNASFVDDLGADSLDTVELVMAFEEAFEIEIPDEDAEKIRTVKDAVDYIGSHAKGSK